VLPIRCSVLWPSGGIVPSGLGAGDAACFSASLVEVFAMPSGIVTPSNYANRTIVTIVTIVMCYKG